MNHSQRIKRQQATMYRSGRLVPFFNSGDWRAAKWCPVCDGIGEVRGEYDYVDGKYTYVTCERCGGLGQVPETSSALRR